MKIIDHRTHLKLLKMENIIKESIAAVLRIQQYLKGYEVDYKKGINKRFNPTYYQQRGKLTSYLFFLEQMGENWIVEQIKSWKNCLKKA
jgi:hypothetical protein